MRRNPLFSPTLVVYAHECKLWWAGKEAQLGIKKTYCSMSSVSQATSKINHQRHPKRCRTEKVRVTRLSFLNLLFLLTTGAS